MATRFRLLITILALVGPQVLAQGPPPLDGPQRTFHDELMGNLVGTWRVAGTVQGQRVEQRLVGSWVHNHQFLRLEYEGLGAVPEGEPRYTASVFVGFDNTSERYVAHWLDVFGGRFSETLGYGTRAGDSLNLRFEYPDGPFENVFTWRPETRSWRFLLRAKQRTGEWEVFADMVASPESPLGGAPSAGPSPAPVGAVAEVDVAALEAEVRATEAAFARSMADRDHAAFTSFLAEETVFVGRSVRRGRQAVAEGWKPYFDGPKAPFAWAPDRVAVIASGKLAFSSGPVFDPDGKRDGTFNSVWRHEPDGSWKIVLDAGCPPCGNR